MKKDKYGLYILEQNPEGNSGNLGDACAENARIVHLQIRLIRPTDIPLQLFRTALGYVRHPDSPWRENDMSSDQLLPLYLCYKQLYQSLGYEMFDRIERAKWHTGNGDIVSPGFYAFLKDWQWLVDANVLAQALILNLPYRWSDSKKWFEKTGSADFLNWIHAAFYAPHLVREFISKKTLKEKVASYYAPEPNSQFLIDLYNTAIDWYF